nr:acyl-CoA dehydrogenase N-terminal domain-containing protein [Thauera phenolivorans]
MSDYIAPVQDMRFVMDEIVGLDAIAALPGYEEATPDMADAILEEAAEFASGVLAPLNRIGGTQGCKLGPDGVVTADGWKPVLLARPAADRRRRGRAADLRQRRTQGHLPGKDDLRRMDPAR